MPVPAESQNVRLSIPNDLSVYQDVVLDGRVVQKGVRSCEDRWRLIEPHLPSTTQAVLDVGSNFGWFGLRLCEHLPRCVVGSIEADLRSAAVQRSVLASHDHRRVCLMTQTVTAARLRNWADSGQRFDAALVFAVLHWMPDHKQVLAELGRLANQLFIELPEPDESAVGLGHVRQEMGRLDHYLTDQFPGRSVECLGMVDGPSGEDRRRRLWRVGPMWNSAPRQVTGLDVMELFPWRPCWPQQGWWQQQLAHLPHCQSPRQASTSNDALVFSCEGLQAGRPLSERELASWRHRFKRLPEKHLDHRARLLWRRARRAAARLCGL